MTSSRRRLLSAMHLGGLTFRKVCLRTWTKINEHGILTCAVAISFYALAALVPILALVITLSAWFLPRIAWVLPLVKQDATGQGTAAANAIALLQDLLPADAASLKWSATEFARAVARHPGRGGPGQRGDQARGGPRAGLSV